jgi:cytochrome c biogenesis protein CcdA
MNQVLGPFLVLIGLGMMGWLRVPLPSWKGGHALRERTARSGLAGAAALGVIFALSFCPVSAGLFFGALVPLAAGAHSRVVLPAMYGIGTGLPVMVFAMLLAMGARGIGRAFHALSSVERVARPVTAGIFVAAGLYLSATHLLELGL